MYGDIPSSHRPLVCVLDDDDLMRDFVCGVLRASGFVTVQAADGLAGLREIERTSPSVVVTDIIMPRCDGLEVITALKQRQPGTRIVAMSGGGRIENQELLHMAAQLGADECIAKPFRAAELVAKVMKLALPTLPEALCAAAC